MNTITQLYLSVSAIRIRSRIVLDGGGHGSIQRERQAGHGVGDRDGSQGGGPRIQHSPHFLS